MPSTASPEVDEGLETTLDPDLITLTTRPWVTIVWNDPVNLFSYVIYVFQQHFGYDRAQAEKLTHQVHEEGRAVVSNGTREAMERDVQAMHEYGLWATMARDE